MELLEGARRDYDWGSTDAIPELLGVPATTQPLAELWLGAHPAAPALVGAEGRPLDEEIARDPVGALGEVVAGRFGALPFLLKVLAAAAPLSLQAHPSTTQAEAGFAREEAAGIPVDAPHRSFRDRSHKPELVCALTPFEVLCGFRDPVATLDVLSTIDTRALDPVRDRIASDPSPDGMRGLLGWLLTLDTDSAAVMVGDVLAACRAATAPRGEVERDVVVRLAERHPDDAGVVTSLLLNHAVLEPGEALFLGAGNLHMYLGGTAVEIMASSDNVLRGGLTSKHIDVMALLDIVDPAPMTPTIQRPVPVDGVVTYDAPVPDFRLQRISVAGEVTVAGGPAVLLCTEGVGHIGSRTVDRGTAVWVPATEAEVVVEGTATVFRAGVGEV